MKCPNKTLESFLTYLDDKQFSESIENLRQKMKS